MRTMATGWTMIIASREPTDQYCSGGAAFDDYHGSSRCAEVRHVRDTRKRGAVGPRSTKAAELEKSYQEALISEGF